MWVRHPTNLLLDGRPFEFYRRLVKETETHFYYANSRGWVEMIGKKYAHPKRFKESELIRVNTTEKQKTVYCLEVSDRPLKELICSLFLENYKYGDEIIHLDGDWRNCSILNFRAPTRIVSKNVEVINKETGETMYFDSFYQVADYLKVGYNVIRNRALAPQSKTSIPQYTIISRKEKRKKYETGNRNQHQERI